MAVQSHLLSTVLPLHLMGDYPRGGWFERDKNKALFFIVTAFFFAQFVKILLRAYSTPLRSIPGPWHSKFTNFILKKNVVTGRRLHYIHELHTKYGDVVRVAPNEVHVASLEGYHTIHKIGKGFLKDSWYPKFRTHGTVLDVFALTDPKQHATRRRLLSRPFSNTSLRENWEAMVMQKTKLLISKIKNEATGGKCDILQWFTLYTTDVIGQIAFGETFNMVEMGERSDFIKVFDVVGAIGSLRAELYPIYWVLKLIPKAIFDVDYHEKKVMELGRKVLFNANNREMAKRNIFSGMLDAQGKDGSDISSEVAVMEATGLIAAGSGTTAITLTYLIWAVLSNSRIQDALENELKSLSPDFTDVDLEALPYLNAVIQESLRLFGAAPGALPRVVPSEGLEVSGFLIPPGTVVSTQAYTIHRNSGIFESPKEFIPERFIRTAFSKVEQKSAFAAFGGGSRTCLGQHLAFMELRHVVALFFRECAGARLALETTDEVMDIENFFLISPKGGFCKIEL